MFHFWNLHQTSNILKKKMVVITTLFQKLQTVKDFIRLLKFKCNYLSNQKPCPFFCSISGIYIEFWTCWKENDRHSYSFSEIADCQRLVLNTLLKKPFQNTLRTLFFGNYRLPKTCLNNSLKNTVSEHSLTVIMLKSPTFLCENWLWEFFCPIKMQLSSKPKTFSHFFFDFWNLNQTLNILKKKYDRGSYFVLLITDCQRLG